MKTLQKLGLAAVLAASVGTAMANPGHHVRYKFKADMSPAQIVGPTFISSATGDVKITFSNDLSSATYTVNANTSNPNNPIVAAHFHCAQAGINPPQGVSNVITEVPVDPNNAGNISVTRTITSVNELIGVANCGTTIVNMASFLNAVLNGDVYINIHSADNTRPGELRGQIYPALPKTRY